MDLDVNIDQTSTVPPFEQLRSQVATQVAERTLEAGTRLPTVRAMAEDLGLAVNTVAKAYRALESDGVIETRGRAGTFVASTGLGDPSGDLTRAAREYIAAARRSGLTGSEAAELVRREWGTR